MQLKPGDTVHWYEDCGSPDSGPEEPTLISGEVTQVLADGSVMVEHQGEEKVVHDVWIVPEVRLSQVRETYLWQAYQTVSGEKLGLDPDEFPGELVFIDDTSQDDPVYTVLSRFDEQTGERAIMGHYYDPDGDRILSVC